MATLVEKAESAAFEDGRRPLHLFARVTFNHERDLSR